MCVCVRVFVTLLLCVLYWVKMGLICVWVRACVCGVVCARVCCGECASVYGLVCGRVCMCVCVCWHWCMHFSRLWSVWMLLPQFVGQCTHTHTGPSEAACVAASVWL